MLLCFQVLALQALAHLPHHQARYGQEYKYEDGELPAYENHHSEAHRNHNRVLEEHIDARHDGSLYFSYVHRYPGEYISLALVGEEAQGEG